MDANQEEAANPFGMDEDCPNCEALRETRTNVVHGYGDVGADFLFVGEMPGAAADRVGVPFTGGGEGASGGDDPGGAEETSVAGRRLLSILRRLGLCGSPADAAEPELANVFLTNLTRCRHPDRAPTDEEVANCDPFLTAEIRMINPEIIVTVGERALATIAEEYTTKPAETFDVETNHGERIRGRGFEIVPMRDPATMTDEDEDEFVYDFSELMASDYRQTKGRRGR